MSAVKRVRVTVEGTVQGVGFRPFVYRQAVQRGLSGWVRNTPAGVAIEAQGEESEVGRFLTALEDEAPPLAVVTTVTVSGLPAVAAASGFTILASAGGERSTEISPDCDVCPDCLRELFDPADRRYRYPFINCTNCGPRYSIITGIPYDRPSTTMAGFAMCPVCRAEYDDPLSRRFHAQPNACPVCGPRLRLVDASGRELAGKPVAATRALLQKGLIVAVKGVGGFHLAVDAGNEEAVRELRRRKRRDEKPFALMAADLDAIGRFAQVDAMAARLLAGTERPIVLLPKRPGHAIAPAVAPANGWFGVMLPAAPLHYLLVEGFTALVMTSANLSDEPLVHRDEEARQRLSGIADAFLCHDREIESRCDDSVVRVFRGEPLFLRRSRGYVPRGVRLPAPQSSVLAVGAELKGAVCLTRGERGYLSPHIGDLKNAATLRVLEETAAHLERLLDVRPQCVAHDLHPDYLSTAFAEAIPGLPRVAVQHHHAHLAACMAEHGLDGEVLGVIFDGTGLGSDGTVWGGEFLVGGYAGFRRAGHLACVPLPGGDAAVRAPVRMAASHLHALFGDAVFDLALPCWQDLAAEERSLLLAMLSRGINAPPTSSCGRLFDAAAAMLGVRSRVSYEGQAALELEALAEAGTTAQIYPITLIPREGTTLFDPGSLFRGLLADLEAGTPRPEIARRFHNSVARGALEVCLALRPQAGNRVVLSGGVFQNRLLTEGLAGLLEGEGFEVFVHRLVPPNDGGIALGQAVIAGRTAS
ncbi:MAG TPA: carbamoyltransferase HypF [Geobacteraceae bacterium]